MKPLIVWDDPVAYPLKEEIEYFKGLKKFQNYLDRQNIHFLVLVESTNTLESHSILEETKPASLIKNETHKGGSMNRKVFWGFLALLIISMAATWQATRMWGCNCSPKQEEKLAGVNSTPAPTSVPTSVVKLIPTTPPSPPAPKPEVEVKTKENYNELVFVNQLGIKVPVTYSYKDDEKTKMVNKSFKLKVTDSELNVLVNGKRKHFRFKSDQGGRITHKIKA